MQHCIVIILFMNRKFIFFIVIITRNLIKQRNQYKTLYNISNYGLNKVRKY